MGSTSDYASSARPSMSDTANIIQKEPVGLFDHYLKFLSESYLRFFQERAQIEEQYATALLKLHQRGKTIDVYLDEKVESSSARRAWGEVRDNVEREAQARQAFHIALVKDVINPLSALKDTQDRIRNRIKEDIKQSSNAYLDYAENTLSRLKRAYFKKCQDVEEQKQSHAPPLSQDPAPPNASKSNPGPPVPPVVTGPQPLRPLTRRASGHQTHQQLHRNRSSSTSTPLQDLAHQGKRQFNQLRTYLDAKGGITKEGFGGRGDNAIRSVRAKREAEEADKEYRKGIHYCETLRIRRRKTLEGAYKSLELFVQESAEVLKKVLSKYADSASATASLEDHLASHAHSMVEQISSQQDIQPLSSAIPGLLVQATPRRILYHNFHIGECKDLIFGVSLVDYATAHGLHEGDVPKVVWMCVEEVERRGMVSEGIYRVSGRHAVIRDLMYRMEKDEARFQFAPQDDVFAVASLLKQYLRELPEPVFRFPLEDRIKHTDEISDHIGNNFMFLRGKMRRLPPVHQATLRLLLSHLSRIAGNAEKNRMDAKNVAIIFGAIIFGEDELPETGGELLAIGGQSWRDTLMEDLIVYAPQLLDGTGLGSSGGRPGQGIGRAMSPVPPVGGRAASPLPPDRSNSPLPPLPPGAAPASYAFGSSFTTATVIPAPSQVPLSPPSQAQSFMSSPPHSKSSSVETDDRGDGDVESYDYGYGHGNNGDGLNYPEIDEPEDFTPQMPARPSDSIHPSRRAAVSSGALSSGAMLPVEEE